MENWKYACLVDQIHRTAYKRHENFVLGSLIHDPLLSELKVITQHYVRLKDSNYALIDIFFPQLNLAVEVDEPHHEGQRDSDQ